MKIRKRKLILKDFAMWVENLTVQLSTTRNRIKAYSITSMHRDACRGSTDTPEETQLKSTVTLRLGNGFSRNRPGMKNEDENEAKVGTFYAMA